MLLENWREIAKKFTEKLSDINRQLAFAGIAVIWIFKVQIGDKLTIPDELILPLIFIVSSLCFDLMHYLYGSIAWTIFHRVKENALSNKKIDKTADIKAPKWIPNLTYVFFFSKVATNIIGFIFLFIYLFNELI